MKEKLHRYLHFRIIAPDPGHGDVFSMIHEGVVRVLVAEEPAEKIAAAHQRLLSSFTIIEIEYNAAFAYHDLIWKDGAFRPDEPVYEQKGV